MTQITPGGRCVNIRGSERETFPLCEAASRAFHTRQQNVAANTRGAHCVLEMCHSAHLHGGDPLGVCFTTIVEEGGGGIIIVRQRPQNPVHDVLPLIKHVRRPKRFFK